MFFKRKNNNQKDISVANLYLCVLGIVSRTDTGYQIDSRKLNKPFTILELKESGIQKVGISPIYGVSYNYFHDSYCNSFIGQVMMFKSIPLIQLEGINREYYSVEELKYLEEQLNRKDKEQNVIDDAVMQEIKKLIDLATNIFDKNRCQEILSKLNSLGVFYVNELINIRSNKNRELSIKDPETALIAECLRQIVEVESEIKEELANSSLQKDLSVLERSLRGN